MADFKKGVLATATRAIESSGKFASLAPSFKSSDICAKLCSSEAQQRVTGLNMYSCGSTSTKRVESGSQLS